jgi:hypothetical protein
MGISHGNRGNTILHIVIGEEGRGSEGLSLKIRPYVEDLFLAYLLEKSLIWSLLIYIPYIQYAPAPLSTVYGHTYIITFV